MAIYEPISPTQFRVVHILPGQPKDPLRCVLEVRTSEAKTAYEALSYEWGAGLKATRVIGIANQPSPRPARDVPKVRRLGSTLDGVLNMLGWPDHLTISQGHLSLGLLFAVATWRWTRTADVEAPPAWFRWFTSQASWKTVVRFLYGCSRALLLLGLVLIPLEYYFEVKPWPLVLIRQTEFIPPPPSPFAFSIVAVTPNLELALRHLRRRSQRRTLWIDALCINQEDEDEKMAQIQRMGVIYASAAAVVVWLGDCHGIGGRPSCLERRLRKRYGCRHRNEIEEAFNLMNAPELWTFAIPRIFGRVGWPDEVDFAIRRRCMAARRGFLRIARRGWWRRLWVVQEVLLAMGGVTSLQCGHCSCPFRAFREMHNQILGLTSRADVDVYKELVLTDSFMTMVNRFQSFAPLIPFSGPIGTKSKPLWAGIVDSVFASEFGEMNVSRHTQYLGRRLPRRLLRVLLWMAGYFECRYDGDRPAAVLGIVAGVEKAPGAVAKLIQLFTRPAYEIVLAEIVSSVVEYSLKPDLTASYIFKVSFLTLHWHAKHWAFSRPPEYIIPHSLDVLQAIQEDGRGEARQTDGELFCALARYLARSTRSLAFLEAAPFLDDEDGTPSWVPTWRKKVDQTACTLEVWDHSQAATDKFFIVGKGRILLIVGLDCGHVTNVPATGLPRVRGLAERWVWDPNTLSIRYRKDVEDSEGGGGFGLVRAGDVRVGDRIVCVPGCLNTLVLRRVARPGSEKRWRLVGLVRLSADLGPMELCWRYTEAEWERLQRERALNWFTIV